MDDYWVTAVIFTITTWIIACPHALGLAIPLVTARSTSLEFNRGLLVKDRQALKMTQDADVIILDKNGYFGTAGEFKNFLANIQEEIIALLAGIEGGSSHPIAQSIA